MERAEQGVGEEIFTRDLRDRGSGEPEIGGAPRTAPMAWFHSEGIWWVSRKLEKIDVRYDLADVDNHVKTKMD